MPQNKNMPAWTNLEPTLHKIMKQYLADHNMTISEFVRACIASRLVTENYLSQEQLELILYGPKVA